MPGKSKKDWFEDWFDSPYYHRLYKDRDEKEAEAFIDNLFSYLNPSGESKILDIPCGKGRHALYMNKKGYDVTGFDLSTESIAYASKFSNERLQFKVHDMRNPLTENVKYDLVLNLFTSFGYFEKEEEDIKVMSTFVNAMSEEGYLVLDFMNTEAVLNTLVKEEEKNVEGLRFFLQRQEKDSFIEKKITFEDKGQIYSFTERVKVLYREKFEKYFNFVGLKIERVFGDYKLSEYDQKNSKRMIFIAKKN